MATTVPDLPVLLFDGDCAFCSSCARFGERRITGAAPFVAWQFTAIDELGVGLDEVDQSVVWVRSPTDHSIGADAVADLLGSSTSRWWRAAGQVLALPPVLVVARPLYRLISRNRHRMPGGTTQCSLPQAQRSRPDDPTIADPG